MAKRLSIIVPVYNVESYLCQCLDSIYGQIESCDEVILIDDGSTDLSPLICDNYKKKYCDTTLVIHKERSGPSDSRNIGTLKADGEFICYVDSDDWLSPTALVQMLGFAKKNDCDIVQANFYYAYPDHLLYKDCKVGKDSEGDVITRDEAMSMLIRNGFINNFLWGKVYKKDIVKKHLLRTDMCMGEDADLQYHLIHDSKNIGISPLCLYYYRQHTRSLSTLFSSRHIGLLEAYENRTLFIRENYPSLFKEQIHAFWYQSYIFYNIAKRKSEEERLLFSTYWNKINTKYHLIFKEELRYDIDYRLYKFSPFVFRTFCFFYKVRSCLFRFLKRSDYKRIDV
ncbi:MAG: glycosyltransferase family 2 protein [Bacteroidaceae bacterium]|nr:glycosyltransferase family 2 protein [Bacteroidaceae bacterium]